MASRDPGQVVLQHPVLTYLARVAQRGNAVADVEVREGLLRNARDAHVILRRVGAGRIGSGAAVIA